MVVSRLVRFILLGALAAFTGVAAHAQTNSCLSYGPQPTIATAFGLGDGQGSDYYLVQVCGLEPGVSVVLSLLVQDFNTNSVLLTGQAPTDVNGIAHFNVTGVPPDVELMLTVTCPDNPSLSYSNATYVGNGSGYSLAGQYVFQFQGTTTQDSRPVELVGTFLANGLGAITAGEADLNSADGVFEKVPLTGTYTFNATTSSAVINLSTSIGAQTFQVALNSSNEGALISGSGPLLGTGKLTQMTPNITIVPYFRYGSYATEVSGTLPCDFVCQLLGEASTVAATGIFCLGCVPAAQPDSEPVFSIVSDQIAGGEPTFGVTQNGMTGPLDSFYRFVLTDSTSSSNSTPTRYAAYVVSGFEMYLISLDPQDQRAAVSGTATQINP